jgi:malonyl-CoA/methylmalonyl-CoA synthetase
MIIRSGFNVYPGEVEHALNSFPGIQRSGRGGPGRSRWQRGRDRLCGAGRRQPAGRAAAALQAHLREHLAPYKRPFS